MRDMRQTYYRYQTVAMSAVGAKLFLVSLTQNFTYLASSIIENCKLEIENSLKIENWKLKTASAGGSHA